HSVGVPSVNPAARAIRHRAVGRAARKAPYAHPLIHRSAGYILSLLPTGAEVFLQVTENCVLLAVLDHVSVTHHHGHTGYGGEEWSTPVCAPGPVCPEGVAGQGARTDSGRVKCTVSRVISCSETVMCPNPASAWTISSTRCCGADAPAVRPTGSLPRSQSGRMSRASSTRWAGVLHRSASSTSRRELEELVDPTTNRTSDSCAISLTASCRLVLASQMSSELGPRREGKRARRA